MALVNPQIAMSYRPTTEYQPRNALAEYAQMQQILNAQDVQQMNALKMQEAQSALQERNALRQLNPSDPDYLNQLARVNPQLAIQYRKEQSAAQSSEAERQTRLAQGAKTRRELLTSAVRDISTRPSDANITAHLEDVESSTLFTPEEKQAVRSSVQGLLALPLEERMSAMASLGATPSELKPKITVGPSGAFTTPAFGGPAAMVSGTEAAFAQKPAVAMTPEAEQQRIRIAAASRPPAQPRAEQPLEKVVDPATGKIVFVSREEALRGRMTPAAAMESLSPKEIQKREAVLPQATSAVQGFESKSDKFIADLTALKNHPGLSSITGIAAGRIPGLTAEGRAAQALYDKIVAKGGFQALQDLRDASKTGGALGSVSNQEGKQLVAAFAAIDRRQDAPDVKAAIDQAIADIQGSRTRMREAYDATYAYKSGNEPTAKPAPAPGGVVDFGSLR